MKKGRAYIGTSGWHYKHWKGKFYPDYVAESRQFDFYRTVFSTVELNNSFYMLPLATTFDKWRNNSGKDFIFSVKASRFITHLKKLNLSRENIREFFSRVDHLQDKLGVILFQLPPGWGINLERLEHFLSVLPAGYRYTFEFRDHSWYEESVYDLLRKFNCSFCIYELERHLSPMVVTASFVYVRLHGPGNKYQGSYTPEKLDEWAAVCAGWQKEGKDVYVYFDNDQDSYAAFNAKDLKNKLGA